MIKVGLIASLLFLGLVRVETAEIPAGVPARSLVAVDTVIVDSVATGGILVRQLPVSLGGKIVQEYHSVRVPVESWLHGTSFFWRPPTGVSSPRTITFRADLAGGAADTVFLQVRIGPPAR